MRALHQRHRPRSTSQLTIGRLSNAATVRPHDGQRERGRITDSYSPMRWMQTLKKLPQTAPHTAATAQPSGPNASCVTTSASIVRIC